MPDDRTPHKSDPTRPDPTQPAPSGGPGDGSPDWRVHPRSRFDAQLNLILDGLPGATIYPPVRADGDDPVDYIHRSETVMVRDADRDRVLNLLTDSTVIRRARERQRPARDRRRAGRDRPGPGLTLMSTGGRSVEDACQIVDDTFGPGVATPDHVLYLCGAGTCPATEPEEVWPGMALNPPPMPDDHGACTGADIMVSVIDSGLVDGAAAANYWLGGVGGDPEDTYTGSPPAQYIRPYAGHGTFVAGMVRTTAPAAQVYVENAFQLVGAAYEFDLVNQLADALDKDPDIISLSAGCTSRADIPLLGFDVLQEEVELVKGLVLVAAAGNDASDRPFYPAASPYAVGVGALSANWKDRAWFSNFGRWVDVYAPGEALVNAFATGTYICDEPPNRGQERVFSGLARWSGTSFSTPLVAGMIASRMSATGMSGKAAAAALLAEAGSRGVRGVGPILLPDQACPPSASCGCGCH